MCRLKIKVFLFFLILLAVNPIRVSAQNLSLRELINIFNTEGVNQTYRFDRAGDDLVNNFNEKKYKSLLASFEDYLLKNPNPRLTVRFFLYQRIGYFKLRGTDTELNAKNLKSLIGEAQQLKDEQLLSELYCSYAYYAPVKQRFYYLLKGVLIKEKIGAKHFSDISQNYRGVSEILHENADFANSAKYAVKALNTFRSIKTNFFLYILSADIAGSSFLKLKQPDSAAKYYSIIKNGIDDCLRANYKGYPSMTPEIVKIWQGVVKGGMAKVLALKGNDTVAYRLLKENLASSIASKQWDDAAQVQIFMASIDARSGNSHSELQRYLKAYQWASVDKKLTSIVAAAGGLAKCYAVKKRFDSAFFYQQIYHSSERALEKKVLNSKLDVAQAQVAYDEISQDLLVSKNELSAQRSLRNFSIVFILLVALIAILLVSRKDLQLKMKIMRIEREKDQLVEEKQNALKSISQFARNIVEKNQLINNLEQKINSIEDTEAKALLENYTILTSEDWSRFKKDFEKVYPGYVERMINKIPTITLGEQRILLLAKLDLSNREMASAMGVSTETVRSVISRFRKKVALEQDIYTIAEGV